MLASDIEIRAVVTNPDRPAGRGMNPRPSPVKEAALAAGIEVVQPRSARDPELHERLAEWAPDVAVVVAYGKILPADLLAVPRRGFVNVHFSLLPYYRGAAPVQRAVMDGAPETGVSIMVLTEGMDEGPVLATATTSIAPDDTAGSVGDRLAAQGAKLLVDALPRYLAGSLDPQEQDHARATYAGKLTSEEARIDWSRPAQRIDAFVRALDPAPGAWTMLGDKRLKVFGTKAVADDPGGPGEILDDARLVVGTGTAPIELTSVQLEGKKRMSGVELMRGLRVPDGARLE